MEEIRYGSLYGGVIVDNADPQKVGRCKIKVGILGDAFPTEWAWPVFAMSGKDAGEFSPPPVDASVFVMFLEGDPEHPVYLGGFYSAPGGAAETPTEFQRTPPTNRGFKTPGGHLVEYDDADPTKGIRLTSSSKFKVNISDKDQAVTIQTPGGNIVMLDDKNKKVVLKSTGKKEEDVEEDSEEKVGGDKSVTVDGDSSQEVNGDWTVQVEGDATVSASGQCELAGEGGTAVGSSGSVTDVDGAQVQLGGGGLPVARLGDMVTGVGNLGIPVISQIIQGSSKVTSS